MTMELISVSSFCIKYRIEASFIDSLENGGLIRIVTVNNDRFIPYSLLPQLERYIRWHYDLDINPEGIETVQYLLYKIDLLKQEVAELKSRLKVYEGNP